MIKLENKVITQCACNNGSSAMVSKQGELYILGKDVLHTDPATGLVTELKDVTITQVALGKAHAVALTNKGHVYTFGINNKGQCGREYMPGASRESK
jgi:E3 ubiquitin-protein ligase MYCBP2